MLKLSIYDDGSDRDACGRNSILRRADEMEGLAEHMHLTPQCRSFDGIARDHEIPRRLIPVFQRFLTCDLSATAVRLMAKFVQFQETRAMFDTGGMVNKRGALVADDDTFAARAWKMHEDTMTEFVIWLELHPELGEYEGAPLYRMAEMLCVKRCRIVAGQIACESFDVYVLCRDSELVAVDVSPPKRSVKTEEKASECSAEEGGSKEKRERRRGGRRGGRNKSKGKQASRPDQRGGAVGEKVQPWEEHEEKKKEDEKEEDSPAEVECDICFETMPLQDAHKKACECKSYAHPTCMQRWNALRSTNHLATVDCMIHHAPA